MRGSGGGGERLFGLFLIGAAGFAPPLLTLFNWPRLVAGIPLLFLYVFALWVLLVALAGFVILRLEDAPEPPGEAERPAEAAAEPR